jgi:hypothetical protein
MALYKICSPHLLHCGKGMDPSHHTRGVALKKVQLESSFRARDAHASRHRAKVCAGGIWDSLIDLRLTINGQLSIENKQPIRVMLGLQMTLEGSCC